MKTVVISDLHIPYHDAKLVDKVIDFIIELKPYEVIINGDFLDMYEISSFDKNPVYSKSLSEEFKIGRKILEKLRNGLPAIKMVFIAGNHEHRWNRFLVQNAPQLISLPGLSIEEQMGLDEMRIQYVDSGLKESMYDTEKGVVVGHWNRVSKHSSYTAKALLDDKNFSLVQGHTHRLGIHYRTTPYGLLQAAEGGCLCETHPSYVLQPNWQNGFIIIEWLPKKNYIIQPILINNGKFVYGGQVI